MNSKELIELGFESAGTNLKQKEDMKRKLTIAYEHYRFVTPANIDRFQAALKEKTEQKIKCTRCNGTGKLPESSFTKQTCYRCNGTKSEGSSYDTLKIQPISSYPKIPPQDVLDAIKIAKERGCFDYYEVAEVKTIEVRPDPIIFGGVNGCQDRFFIAQWDNDVKIDDILKENEG